MTDSVGSRIRVGVCPIKFAKVFRAIAHDRAPLHSIGTAGIAKHEATGELGMQMGDATRAYVKPPL